MRTRSWSDAAATERQAALSCPGRAAKRRGLLWLLPWVVGVFPSALGAADAPGAEAGAQADRAARRETLSPGFAPADLTGKQFTLDGISPEGISEEVTVIFREGRQFTATRLTPQGATRTDKGRYTYRRTGPYTGMLTTRNDDSGKESCTTYLTFTSAAAGVYTLSPCEGHASTGNFQLTVEDPFCLSLWDGLPCAAAANLPQVIMGPRGRNLAAAEVVITNTDLNPPACEVALLFHRGTSPAPAVSFNGQPVDRNLFQTAIPRRGTERVTLTAPDAEELVSGALYVYARSPCTADSLRVQGRSLFENPVDGEIEEWFLIAGQPPQDWLGDGDCRVLTGVFGNGRNAGFASVAAQPGQAAPPGTRFRFRAFDLKGNLIGPLPGLPISGVQDTVWPWSFNQPRILRMCLDVPVASNFQLAVIAMGSRTAGARVRYAPEGFVDRFRLGDASAWSPRVPFGGN